MLNRLASQLEIRLVMRSISRRLREVVYPFLLELKIPIECARFANTYAQQP